MNIPLIFVSYTIILVASKVIIIVACLHMERSQNGKRNYLLFPEHPKVNLPSGLRSAAGADPEEEEDLNPI